MRRLLVVCLIVLFGSPLGAGAANSYLTKPNVIVYPFIANGTSVDREASSRLATLIATQMANTGKVTVTPPPPGTERKDYLTVARANNADYYITGYISPLGNGVSLVEQVVSVGTGIVIYSTSAQLQTYADAAGQGDILATYVAQHANRTLAAIGTAPPAASPSPPPSQEAQANLGKIFGRKKKAPATPKPTSAPLVTATAPAAALRNVTPPPATATPRPVPVAAATARPLPVPPSAAPTRAAASSTPKAVAAAVESYAVVPVDGSADAAQRELATARIIERTHGERVTNGAAACAAEGALRGILNGTLSLRPDQTFGGTSATFELTVSDCGGHIIFRRNYTADAGGAQSAQIATERVVDAAVGAFLNPPKHR